MTDGLVLKKQLDMNVNKKKHELEALNWMFLLCSDFTSQQGSSGNKKSQDLNDGDNNSNGDFTTDNPAIT